MLGNTVFNAEILLALDKGQAVFNSLFGNVVAVFSIPLTREIFYAVSYFGRINAFNSHVVGVAGNTLKVHHNARLTLKHGFYRRLADTLRLGDIAL